ALRNREGCHASATIESPVPEAGDAVGNRDVSEALASAERPAADTCYAAEDRNVRQTYARGECTIANVCGAAGDSDAGQVGARQKGPVSNVPDTVANHDADQTPTVGKSGVPNGDNAVGDSDAGQADALGECIACDPRDGIWDLVTTSFALREFDQHRLVLVEQYSIHTAVGEIERRHDDRSQAAPITESDAGHISDAGGNHERGQAGAARERSLLDTGD